MRLNRNTLLLLGALLIFIVGAAIALNSAPATPAGVVPTLTESEALVLPDIRFAEVKRLTIADAAGASVTVLQNEDLSWSIEGRQEAVQQMAVDTAIANLVNIQASERFTAEDLSAFGLTEPPHTLTINNGSQDLVLRIGNRNVSGSRLYALREDQPDMVYLLNNPSFIATLTGYLATPPVVVIQPTAVPALDRAGLLFPEYDAQRIVRLSFTNNVTNETLILLKQADETWVLDPFSTNFSNRPLDQLLSSTLAQAYGTLRAVDVLTNVSDAAALGLEPPLYTLLATRNDGYEYPVQVGGSDPSGARQYARVFELANVAVMDREEVGSLLQFIGMPPYDAAFSFEATAEATQEP